MRTSTTATRVMSLALVVCTALAGCSPRGGSRPAPPEPAAPTTTPRGVLGGEMQYMADAARFFECGDGRSYPIAMEADFVAMERAYGTAASAPGARLYVTFEGSIVPRPKMEGEGTEPTVVVSRFIHAWPTETCERSMADASLAHTYWRIVQLGGDDIRPAPGAKEPHLILREEEGGTRFSATVGCNQMAGACTVTGASIRFGDTTTTLMACPPPLDALERKLAELLSAAASWVVVGQTLEIYDASGASIGLFRAVYF